MYINEKFGHFVQINHNACHRLYFKKCNSDTRKGFMLHWPLKWHTVLYQLVHVNAAAHLLKSTPEVLLEVWQCWLLLKLLEQQIIISHRLSLLLCHIFTHNKWLAGMSAILRNYNNTISYNMFTGKSTFYYQILGLLNLWSLVPLTIKWMTCFDSVVAWSKQADRP